MLQLLLHCAGCCSLSLVLGVWVLYELFTGKILFPLPNTAAQI
jgi:hypothetical protein